MAIVAVSFDVWDTLLRLKPFHIEIAQEVATQANLKSSDIYEKMSLNYGVLKEYRVKGLLRYNDIVNHCLELSSENLEVDVELLKKAVTKAVLKVEPDEFTAEGTQEVLKEISRRGNQIVTLGNVIFWPGSYNRILLERAGLTDYFKFQLYADEINSSKPSKKVFLKLCKALKMEPTEIVHIGDNMVEDFEGALDFGLYGIWINSSSEEELKIEGRGAIVNSITKVPSAIEALKKQDS